MTDCPYSVTLRDLRVGDDDTDYPYVVAPTGVGTPTVPGGRVAVFGRDGVIASGPDLLGPRELVFEVWVIGEDLYDLLEKEDRLKAAWAPVADGTVELTMMYADAVRRYRGRPGPVDIDPSLHLQVCRSRARLLFEAVDPHGRSDGDQVALTVRVGALTGDGTDFPATFPFVFTGASQSFVAVAHPAAGGTVPAHWTATITGGVVDPSVMVAGQRVLWPGTLARGSVLMFDSQREVATVNGEPSFVAFGSRWGRLAPGSTPVAYAVSALSGASSSTATIAWEARWL